MSLASQICSVLVEQSRKDIAAKRAENDAREIGEVRLDIDFYSKADAKLPVEDYDFTDASGRHFKGFGARWAVVKVKWDGVQWKRFRKISGPLQFTPALDRLIEECKRLGLERVK